MADRAPVALVLLPGGSPVGVLDPLPPSLSLAELQQAVEELPLTAQGIEAWLTARLGEVTGREYEVLPDLRSWAYAEDGRTVTYQAIGITG
jgi:hypothetical protein